MNEMKGPGKLFARTVEVMKPEAQPRPPPGFTINQGRRVRNWPESGNGQFGSLAAQQRRHVL